MPPISLMYSVELSAFPDTWRLKLLIEGVEVGGGFFHGDEGYQDACETVREWLKTCACGTAYSPICHQSIVRSRERTV